jgi:hypothetical protein
MSYLSSALLLAVNDSKTHPEQVRTMIKILGHDGERKLKESFRRP